MQPRRQSGVGPWTSHRRAPGVEVYCHCHLKDWGSERPGVSGVLSRCPTEGPLVTTLGEALWAKGSLTSCVPGNYWALTELSGAQGCFGFDDEELR